MDSRKNLVHARIGQHSGENSKEGYPTTAGDAQPNFFPIVILYDPELKRFLP